MKIPKWFLALLIILALAGFIDSTYLTVEHLKGVIPPCRIVTGCESVLSSQYATIVDIPVAALGMLYYGTILVLLIAFVDTNNPKIFKVASFLTVFGLLGSAYFVGIQMFALRSYCFYCLVSAGISTLLFIAGMVGIWRYRQAIV